ncbi:MAG: uroporphyrinogen decarboxylase family protein [Candidatus Latescibacteria bacterium]|jgi:uroporphyrinogen decarboxylase|nr:uroporphyrinogen decarboxylase family protein [Candidatus Latescibacterota bacterium]
MTGRERVLAAVSRSGLDRVPVSDAFWEDTLVRWRREGLPDGADPADHFGFDIAATSIDASPRFPAQLLRKSDSHYTMRDRFGYVVTKALGKSRTVQFHSHPVPSRDAWPAVRERFALTPRGAARIDTIPFPFRLETDPTREESLTRFHDLRRTNRYILANAYGPFEATWRLHGYERTLTDLLDDDELIGEIGRTYTEFLMQVVDRCLQDSIVPDGFFLVEDLASTRGMLFSPDIWRRLHKPILSQLGAFLQERDVQFWMHCCGNAEAIFDDLIECGVQVIQPLEAKSGLDVRLLRKRYGADLTFYGNIDVIAMAVSDGSAETEVKAKLSAFDRSGGYIFHSDHSVPPEVSFQRYSHVIDCVRKYGTYA